MDADEALARALQLEEEAALAAQQRQAAAHHLRGAAAATAAFSQQVEGTLAKVLGYEDELAQAMALSVMPLPRLEASADEACAVSTAMGEQPPLNRRDALAFELLSWFKQDFFRWVSAPPCAACGAANTHSTGAVAPTAEEAAHKAGRTELFRCGQCGAATRFPRYNDPVKLLETRRGRCGEWANCFTLCCRAAGLEARLTMDWEDHIWAECWSPSQRRWMHLDPCEAAADKPLLYEAGWGKRLSYVVAVGRHGVADVTRRYTTQYDESRRQLVSEGWLAGYLRHVTGRLRAGLSPELRRELEQRDELDRRQLLSSGTAAAEEVALPARQTGDAAWLAARGEDGSGVARASGGTGAGGAAAVKPPGTRYRLAKDEHLAAASPRRLCGGAVRASGENAPGEAAQRAFDGSPTTKWLDFGKEGAWLEYRLPAEQPQAVLAAYALTSANDSPERDPRHVMLEAWDKGRGAWVMLDEQRSLSFPQRHHRLVLRVSGCVSGATPSRRFRLRVLAVADPAAANSVQLACLDLYVLKRVEQAQQQQQAEEQAQPQPQAAEAAEQQQQTANGTTAAAGEPAQQPKGGEPAVERLAALQLQEEQQAQQQQVELQEPPDPAAPAAPAPSLAPPSDSSSPAGEAGNPWAALFQGGSPT